MPRPVGESTAAIGTYYSPSATRVASGENEHSRESRLPESSVDQEEKACWKLGLRACVQYMFGKAVCSFRRQ